MSIVSCPTCGKHGYESDDTLRALRNDVDWNGLRWAHKGEIQYIDLGNVEVVAVAEDQEYDSYGSRIEDEFFVVVKIPDGRLFKREGWRDSYGSVEWKSDIREVKPQPRTVTIYDYA